MNAKMYQFVSQLTLNRIHQDLAKEIDVMKARQMFRILFTWKVTKWDEVIELPMAQSNIISKIRQLARQIFVLLCLIQGWHCKDDQTDIHIIYGKDDEKYRY